MSFAVLACSCDHDVCPGTQVPAPKDVVYYVGVGDRIKIGYSGELRARLSSLHAEVLLAVEPGDRTLELRRHEQFAHRRLDGEWFAPASDLLDHIEPLVGRYVVPPLPRRTRDGRGNPRGRAARPTRES